MTEVQVFEGTTNTPTFFVPGELQKLGAHITKMQIQLYRIGASAKDPTDGGRLRQIAGNMLIVGSQISKGLANKSKVIMIVRDITDAERILKRCYNREAQRLSVEVNCLWLKCENALKVLEGTPS